MEDGESWSETDEDEDEVRAVAFALMDTPQDRDEEADTHDAHDVVRVPNRAFGKRTIRAPKRFTYGANWQVVDDDE